MNKAQRQNLRRRIASLPKEEQLERIGEIAMEQKLSQWRAWGLKAYRDKALGVEIEKGPSL